VAFGTFSPILVCSGKKNLATLVLQRQRCKKFTMSRVPLKKYSSAFKNAPVYYNAGVVAVKSGANPTIMQLIA
jgi:hypothetical protein